MCNTVLTSNKWPLIRLQVAPTSAHARTTQLHYRAIAQVSVRNTHSPDSGIFPEWLRDNNRMTKNQWPPILRSKCPKRRLLGSECVRRRQASGWGAYAKK